MSFRHNYVYFISWWLQKIFLDDFIVSLERHITSSFCLVIQYTTDLNNGCVQGKKLISERSDSLIWLILAFSSLLDLVETNYIKESALTDQFSLLNAVNIHSASHFITLSLLFGMYVSTLYWTLKGCWNDSRISLFVA